MLLLQTILAITILELKRSMI